MMRGLRQPPAPIGLALVLLVSASAQGRQDPHECRNSGPGSVVTCTTTVTEESQPKKPPEPDRPRSPPSPAPPPVTPGTVDPDPPGPVDPDPPGPVDPDPPGPVDPRPVDPGPVDPRPVDPDPKDQDTPEQCVRCPPPDSPYGLGAWWWWWLPLVSLLALLLSIAALLLALWRRRQERDDGAPGRETVVPVPLPLPGERYPGGGGGVAVVPAPRPSDDQAACNSPLIDFLDARSEELRSVLCTLARMGVAWRRSDPDRARACVGRIETHPFYKGGQVLFDLLEWEDFMLDGEAAVADSRDVGQFLTQVAGWLGLPPPSAAVAGDLPRLEPGFYLYRDVVLGSLAAGLATFPAAERPD